MMRFGPITWTIAVVGGLFFAPVVPTLIGGALGYAVIYRGVLAEMVEDLADRFR